MVLFKGIKDSNHLPTISLASLCCFLHLALLFLNQTCNQTEFMVGTLKHFIYLDIYLPQFSLPSSLFSLLKVPFAPRLDSELFETCLPTIDLF